MNTKLRNKAKDLRKNFSSWWIMEFFEFDNIRDKKLQYDINKEAVKISPLLSGKIDKYELLTGE